MCQNARDWDTRGLAFGFSSSFGAEEPEAEGVEPAAGEPEGLVEPANGEPEGPAQLRTGVLWGLVG